MPARPAPPHPLSAPPRAASLPARACARRLRRALALGTALAATGAVPARAQDLGPGPHVYLLDVAAATEGQTYAPWNLADQARLRLMAAPPLGPVQADLAWDNWLQWTWRSGGTAGPFAAAGTSTGGDWLDLGGTVRSDAHVLWRHRVDRLSLAATAGRFEFRAGRQPISWGTTLFLTPADPFAPFDPADPYREYRTGVDAVRVQYFPGAFSGIDVVVRPARTPVGRTLTALARARATVGGWDLSAWGGVLHDRAAGAAGITRTVAGAALRGEISVRGRPDSGAAVRCAVGADRRWTVAGRDLYAVLEYQHDGFGAARGADLVAVAASAPYRRGEMQVLGRDVLAGQLSWQVHPLAKAELLVLGDLRDGSVLAAPAVSVSASNDVALRGGIFVAAGRGADAFGLPRSEFGALPRSGYLSVSAYF